MENSNFFSKERLSELFQKRKSNDEDDNNKRTKMDNIGDQLVIPNPLQHPSWTDPTKYGGNSILRSDGITAPPKDWDRWTPDYRKQLWERENELRKHPYYSFAIIISGLISTDAVKYLNSNFINSRSLLENELRKESIEIFKIKSSTFKEIPGKITNIIEIKERNIQRLKEHQSARQDIADKLKRYNENMVEYTNYLYIKLFDEIMETKTLDTDVHKMELDRLFMAYFLNDYLTYQELPTKTSNENKYIALYNSIKKASAVTNNIEIDSYEEFNKDINNTTHTKAIQSNIDSVEKIYPIIYDLFQSIVNSKKVSRSGLIETIMSAYENNRKAILEGNLDETTREYLLDRIKNSFIQLVKSKDIEKYILVDKANLGVYNDKDSIKNLSLMIIGLLDGDIKKQEEAIKKNEELLVILYKREEELASGLDINNPKKEYEVDYETSFNSLNTGIISLEPIMGHLLSVRDTLIKLNTRLKNKDLHWFLTEEKIIFIFAKAVSIEIKHTKDNYSSTWHHSDAPDRLKQEKSAVYYQVRNLKV